MVNKIMFLGTAGDVTSVAKGLRKSGGILIQSGQVQLHLDPGPGALSEMIAQKLNPRDTNIILVSHNHLNHCAGLSEIISAMTLGGLDKKGILIAHSSVKDRITSYERELLEKTHWMEEGKELNVLGVHIKALPVKNHDGVGFRIRTAHFLLAATGDTEYGSKLSSEYKDANILIVSCPLPPLQKEKGRMNLDDAMKLIHEAKPDLAIITHFSHTFLSKTHDHIDMARTVQKATGVQTIFAKDGLSIDPLNYSAQLKQKSLGGFLK